MQDYNRSFPPSQSMGEKKQPISLIVRLMQEMANMQHVDDVLLWLATAMTYNLDIPVVQFWALQLDSRGQSHTESRALASQNTSFLQPISLNQQMVFLIHRLLQDRRGVGSVPIEQIYSAEQAPLMIQYGLRYWACCFLDYNALLPPRRDAGAQNVPTPLLMAVSFVLRLPFSEKQERAIMFLLEQALRLLHNRNFLTNTGSQPEKPVVPTTFADIIPQRPQDVEISQASNPFASATILTDKAARRLYAAVDGQKTLAELAQNLALNEKEVSEALQYLLQQGKVVLYTRDEQPLDASLFGTSFS